ncbi:hypothetical protein ACFXJM_24275 [Streptomyces massasporeus]
MNAAEPSGRTDLNATTESPLDVHVYRVPSMLERPQEWRDAAAVKGDRTAFALSDGASSAYRAGPWSRLLAERYLTEAPDHSAESLTAWAERCRDLWSALEEQRKKGRAQAAAARPADEPPVHHRHRDFWLHDAEARSVAAATFLGTKVHRAPEGWSFEAVAVGDSCLLHVRENSLWHAFPLDDARQFGSHPDLLTAGAPLPVDRIHHYREQLHEHDMVLLVSDALAEVLLAQGGPEAGADAARWWRVVRRLDETAFLRFVTGLRAARMIETDDTTMIRIGPRATG